MPSISADPGPLVMGVLNVTPDSFSDGGHWADPRAAIEHGWRLHCDGAHVVDVGGESTRPGATAVSADLEIERVLRVVTGLVARGVTVSIDTMRAEVARAAVGAGASMVNDVSGGLADAQMHATVAQLDVDYVIMHWRRTAAGTMTHEVAYDDVVRDVTAELSDRITQARLAGVAAEHLIVDPGLGFAKDSRHNWTLLAELAQITDLGYPVLLGASRKRFLGALLAGPDGQPRAVGERDTATATISALAARAGVWGVRVHDVRATVDAIAVARAWLAGDSG